MSRTLVIIKPDATERNLIGHVVSRLEKARFKILGMRMMKLSKDQAQEFYVVHKEKPFYNDLVTFTDNRGALIAEVSTEIGYQKSMISNLEEKVELIEKVENLQDKKIKAQGIITDVEDKLEFIKTRNKTRFESVYSEIEEITKQYGQKRIILEIEE